MESEKHSQDLSISTGDKSTNYKNITQQILALVSNSQYQVSNLSNIAAALREQFGWWWVGFYLIDPKKPTELYLGPFQGPVACIRIRHGKGVCGSSWARNETIVVPDVEKFPGHIACSSKSRSQIVVPIRNAKGEITGVLDVDSEHLAHFDEVDKTYLEGLVHQLAAKGIFD